LFLQIFPRVNRYIAVERGSVNQSFNYDQGQAECVKIGTGLAIIRNQTDYNALMSTINKSGILLNRPSKTENDLKIWVSGRKLSKLWTWYTGEVIPTPWFWNPEHPGTALYGCARLIAVTSPFGINDYACDHPGHYYYKLACEWQLTWTNISWCKVHVWRL